MIHVRRVSGEKVAEFPADQLSTVLVLKQRLQQICGLPRFRLRLLRGDAALFDANELAPGMHLTLVVLPLAEVSEARKRELHDAAAMGLEHVVEIMLQRPLHPDSARDGSVTPLYAASRDGHLSTVRLLLEAFADANVATEVGKTPALVAFEGGHREILRLLLESGADKDWRDADGKTLLWRACEGGNADMVQLLIGIHADAEAASEARETKGETPPLGGMFPGA
ncbi:Fem1aa [Symbiodinium natans]|uniref:Fem1aa protein n=1 Tax=Symbiodinium natans TaxID=878477 RepID=A0A812TR27_9DINO|nr:Fem1aa [Symbiodinium natans]